MDIALINQLLANRLNTLNDARMRAFSIGDIEQINLIDKDLMETKNTIQQLLILNDVTTAATNANTTSAEIVTSGIKAIQNALISPVLLENPTGIMLGYDINSYATDPLHEAKIADILQSMGQMNSPADIDTYINNKSIGSPVTGQMVFDASQKYGVDIRLMMAIMEQDSRFGTAGLAIKTLNPGNVGNTDDGNTHTFPSWQEGVNAVAEWLSRHKVETTTENL